MANNGYVLMWMEYNGHIWIPTGDAYTSKTTAKREIAKKFSIYDDKRKIQGFIHANEEGTCVLYFYCFVDCSHDDYIDDDFKTIKTKRRNHEPITLEDCEFYNASFYRLSDKITVI